jgi:anthranilate phosphoribosyltransferase
VLEKFISEPENSPELTAHELALAVEQLVLETVPAQTKADFLCRLALKGETIGEIAAFARALREKSVRVPIEPAWLENHEVLDVCGTGGDRLNTFNISTTVALVCAAAGLPVAKHGNRAITSQAGSADVLEALGIRIDLPPAEAAQALRERHFAFFFAPTYHPAFKHIAAARKICASRGQRTIFNFLGPLLNPARPTAQLVGVSHPQLCAPLAQVLQSLGVRRGMVVSGEVPGGKSKVENQKLPGYLDELSTLGQNTVAQFYTSPGCLTWAVDLKQFPLQPAQLADLIGGDRNVNAGIVRRLLSGEERGPKRDAVLLNAAAALWVANHVPGLLPGWERASELIDSGQAAQKLKQLTEH